MPVQLVAFAADRDEKDCSALLKLSSRARFLKSSGNKIRYFITDLDLFLQMYSRPVHHGVLSFRVANTYEAENVRRSHVKDNVADYLLVKQSVKTLFGKFEFDGSYSSMLRSHVQSGSESIAVYAAFTTYVCSKAYPNYSTETQLSLAIDHFISGLVDSTTRDYLLHDRASRLLTW